MGLPNGDIDRILIPQDKIAARVRELARDIIADHTPPKMQGEPEITIVPILTGAMIFCCDLIRRIPFPMKIGLMTVSSYPGASIRTQGSNILGQQTQATSEISEGISVIAQMASSNVDAIGNGH